MTNNIKEFTTLENIAQSFRSTLDSKKYLLLFAYNGIGKTRLSMEFKNLGKEEDQSDTLYFNAFTEDLFYWDNDLNNDSENESKRELRLNRKSRFFQGLEDLEMDNRIGEFLVRYADFNFKILNKTVEGRDGRDKEVTYVDFEKEVLIDGKLERVESIKISRGEESIFIWCFFLAIVRLAIDSESEDDVYNWVKYIYIDDPISSLDENNIVLIACNLVDLIDQDDVKQKFVISTHHNLFLHILVNEFKSRLGRNWEKNLKQFSLELRRKSGDYILKEEKGDTPLAYHLTILKNIQEAISEGSIEVYHFNLMRSLLEKTASFFGYKGFGECLEGDNEDVYCRLLNMYSHGKDSSFDFRRPSDDDREMLESLVDLYIDKYDFAS